MGQGRHTLRSISDPVYPQQTLITHMHYNVQSYDMASPSAVNHVQTSAASAAVRNLICSAQNTAPHHTATRLWAPGPAHGTHGIARQLPQHPKPQTTQYSSFPDTLPSKVKINEHL